MGQKSTRHATAILTRELNGGESEPLYIALHDSDPGPDGDQDSHELSYAGYGRAQVSRVGNKWDVKDGQAFNLEAIDWPIAQGRGKAAKFFSIGTAQFGPGEILRRGKISKPVDGLEIVSGMIPRAPARSLVLTES